MNNINPNGESPCNGREDGDASTGCERPLKKARFAWQVKGKYHLKNETNESNKNLNSPSNKPASEASSSSQASLDTLRSGGGNCLMKQDYNQLDSVRNRDSIIKSQENLQTTSSSKDKKQYPRYLSTFERKAMNNNSLLKCNSCTFVKSATITDTAEDQCIAQWQTRQYTNGRLDNTLNKVLESWMTDPLLGDEVNSRFVALNFAEFINQLPEDNSVENEGILMAISAHGLQNTSSSNSNASIVDNSSTSSTSAYNIPSPLPSMSPIISDEELQQAEDINYEEKSPIKIQDWQGGTENTSDATPFAYFSEPVQSPYEFYDDNNQNSNTDSLDIGTPYDFMNAAVLYAIKSKGLTISGTEYG